MKPKIEQRPSLNQEGVAMGKIEDLEAEWDAVKSGSLEPDPIKIEKAEEEFDANPPKKGDS